MKYVCGDLYKYQDVGLLELEWTTEIPTEPGLYWYTYKFKGRWQKPVEKVLSMFGGELCEEVCGADGGEYEPLKDNLCSGSEWKILGPLPLPEPPNA